MPEREDAILRHAEIIIEAVALSKAMVNGDLQEVPLRVGLVVAKSTAAGISKVASAAALVVDRLRQGEDPPSTSFGQAVENLSVAIDEAQAPE